MVTARGCLQKSFNLDTSPTPATLSPGSGAHLSQSSRGTNARPRHQRPLLRRQPRHPASLPAQCHLDLVYLDPPFNSNRDYNVIRDESGNATDAQLLAFEDTWHWGPSASLDRESSQIPLKKPDSLSNLRRESIQTITSHDIDQCRARMGLRSIPPDALPGRCDNGVLAVIGRNETVEGCLRD
jgi:hypothetical protein